MEINSNLMVQGQGYMVDVMVKTYTFTIDQLWPFFFDRCVQFVHLTTVDIRINRLVLWNQLRKYHTFPIPPNRFVCKAS